VQVVAGEAKGALYVPHVRQEQEAGGLLKHA